MPNKLIAGKSRKAQEHNFHELRHGGQYQRTKRKFGKGKARAQMIAVVLNKAGLSRGKKRRLAGQRRREE